jgi:hypothetical protein
MGLYLNLERGILGTYSEIFCLDTGINMRGGYL